MGSWLSTLKLYNTVETATQTIVATVDVETATQTIVATVDAGTQTAVAFTDRLTNYGTVEVGSTEAFDHVCDLCEREAVGYCKQCEQYYCLRCCQYHEKLKASQHHVIVDKENFSDIPDAHSLFSRNIVPFAVESIPLRKYETLSIKCLLKLSNIKDIAVSDWPWSLKIIVYEDHKNFKITMYNTGIHTTFMIAPLKSLTGNCILASHASSNEFSIYDLDTRTAIKSFKTSGECYGIAEFDNGFAVSIKLETGYSLPDWQVQYLDDKGGIKKQIYYDNQGKPLFSKPEFLASNSRQDVLFVSDNGIHTVRALDVCGNILFTFTHGDMMNPRAMTVDDEDNVYVACGENVVQIHKSGARHRILIQKNRGRADIQCVCFDPASRVLIVGEHSNQMKFFNFLP